MYLQPEKHIGEELCGRLSTVPRLATPPAMRLATLEKRFPGTCPHWFRSRGSYMFSGSWSILILSNNGDADPIPYQRTFDLTVGPQQTVWLSESQIFLLEPLCELPRQFWGFLNSRIIVTTVPVLKDYLLTRVFISPHTRQRSPLQ